MNNIQKHILSKSTFLRGCQCSKSLWLYKHQPELRELPDEQQKAIFEQGTNVGELAQGLYPGGVDASPETPYEYQKSVAETAKYINEGQEIIYEAAFQYDRVLAAIDILIKIKGKWYAYEVKSSTEVKDVYISDAALQYYVITNSGIQLEDISIIHINNEYIREGDLNIHELFTIASVHENVKGIQSEIKTKINELKDVIKQESVPDIDIGSQCGDPYPCDFTAHCWQHIPEYSVFTLRGRGGSTAAMDLYTQGILKLADIPPEYELSDEQRLQVDTHISKEIVIHKTEINDFLKEIEYPLYFMDFETYSLAVPEYDGCWPYQQVPFQYSVHIQREKDGPLEHKEFLWEPDEDPRQQFIYTLINAIAGSDDQGSVIVYNKGFENRILNELSESVKYYHHFPMLCDEGFYLKGIENIQNRIVDLMTPFRKKHYYTADMNGSYSIKKVLPALFPDISYDDLDISDGTMAGTAFLGMRNENDEEKKQLIRKQLLEYCGLDTLAMVKILDKLLKL